jgi:2-hydroxycyclohexanecarboxyl-CoA dehydrogenase
MMNFDGKVAIITGSGRGIGKCAAAKLASLGGWVVIVDIDPDTAHSTAEEIRATNRNVMAVPTDVSDKRQVDAMVDQVLNKMGHVDILINNAGWTQDRPFLEDTPEYWQKLVGINYLAQVYTCRAVLPSMVAQKKGAIVNIASDAARVGTRNQAVYAGTKAAVIAFSKSLVTEFSKEGVRINVVSPSTTDTPLTRAALQPEQIAKRERNIPLGRIGQPEDQANVILFFASDLSGYVNGQVLSVNGGSTRVG